MEFKGEDLKKLIKEEGINASELSRKLGITKVYVYKMYSKKVINVKYLYEIMKIYPIDMRKYFPDLPYTKQEVDALLKDVVQKEVYDELKMEHEDLKTKYIKQLEKNEYQNK